MSSCSNRFYDPMIEAPFSELDYSSDYLDEFHGFLEDEDEQVLNEEDAQIYGAISPNQNNQSDLDDFGIPMVNRAKELMFEEESEYTPFNPNEEEEKTGGLPLRPKRLATASSKNSLKEN